MVTKITMYVAKDGTSYEFRDVAVAHESNIDLTEYVNDNPIMGHTDGCSIDGIMFLEWVRQNDRIFVQLLPKKAPVCPSCESEKWRNIDGAGTNKNALDRVCDNCDVHYSIKTYDLPAN